MSRNLAHALYGVRSGSECRGYGDLEKTVREVGDEFAASDDPKAFAKNNRFGNYRQLFGHAPASDDEASAGQRQQYGPVLNDTWTMTRVAETLNVWIPGVRYIVLPTTNANLADSLTALRQGADSHRRLVPIRSICAGCRKWRRCGA